MKLIIDIPNEIKDQLDHTTDCEMEHYWVQHFSLWIADAIKKGVPVNTDGDSISRAWLKNHSESLTSVGGGVFKFVSEETIDNAPTVEPNEVYMTGEDYNLYMEGYKSGLSDGRKDADRPKGEWIADTSHCYDDDEDTFECSVYKEPFTLICGTPKDNLYNFCPHCGADMRGEGKCI